LKKKIIEILAFKLPIQEIKIYSNLTTLDLRNSGIHYLDETIFQSIEQLTTLNLNNNKLTCIDFEMFVTLKQLTTLLLANNQLISISNNIADQKVFSIKELNLGFNQIFSLSSWIFKGFINLERLVLRYNKLKSIGCEDLNGIKNLNYLSLNNNRLVNLNSKAFIDFCDTLEYLYLGENNLESVEILSGLNSIKVLDFSSKKLANLCSNPSILSHLQKLEYLNLSFNLLRCIDQEDLFNGLINLNELNLSYNQLSILSFSVFKSLDRLQSLNLSNNQLNLIKSKVFAGLKNLNHLYLSFNKLAFLESCMFMHLNNLVRLDLDNNHLISIDLDAF